MGFWLTVLIDRAFPFGPVSAGASLVLSGPPHGHWHGQLQPVRGSHTGFGAPDEEDDETNGLLLDELLHEQLLLEELLDEPRLEELEDERRLELLDDGDALDDDEDMALLELTDGEGEDDELHRELEDDELHRELDDGEGKGELDELLDEEIDMEIVPFKVGDKRRLLS